VRLASLFFACVCVSVLSATSLVNGLALTVNGVPVTLYEIYMMAEKRNVSTQEAVEYIIQEKLREIEAKNRGIDLSDDALESAIEKMAFRHQLSVYGMRQALAKQGIGWEEYRRDFYKKMLEDKVNQSIVLGKMSQPNEEDLQAFYHSNPSLFSRASEITVDKYTSASRFDLEQLIKNPMRITTNTLQEDLVIDMSQSDSRMSMLLNKTKMGTFTPIVQVEEKFVTFYVREKRNLTLEPFGEIEKKVKNEYFIVREKQILREYFERLRAGVQINIVRLPPEQ
jgi:peptidyl-prolyl cis-trans isomerase SurA